jgi:hypothetical protein
VLLPTEMVLGDVAFSNISLSFGTPADRNQVRASVVLNEKVCL